MIYPNPNPDCKYGGESGERARGGPPRARILTASTRALSAPLLWVLFSLLLASLAGCRGHVEGRLEVPPRPMPGEGRSVPGIYFLHDWREEAETCLYLGEITGGAESPAGDPGGPRGRSRAVLQLAEQTRLLGGNVVMLPRFSTEYPEGTLTGQVYRCREAERGRLFEQGAAEERLTVIE